MSESLLRRSRARRRRRLLPALAKAIRLEARVTLAEMSQALHVTESTVSRWESGDRTPRGPLAERYAQVLSRLEAELRRG
jgi:DNA-binding transcriptional regulator YiaG